MASKPEPQEKHEADSSSEEGSVDSFHEEDTIRHRIIATMDQVPRIAEELSKRWKESPSSVEENLQKIEKKMRDFLFHYLGKECQTHQDNGILKHFERLVQDFKDSKVSPNLASLSSISTETAHEVFIILRKLFKKETKLLEGFIEILAAIGLQYFPSSAGAVGAVTGFLRKVTGRTEWAGIERGLDAVTEFVNHIGARLGDHGQWYAMTESEFELL